MIRFACPQCHKVYTAPDNSAGRKSVCKKCGTLVIIPERPVQEFVYGVPLPPEGTVDAVEEPESPTPPPTPPPPPRLKKSRPRARLEEWEDDGEPIRSGSRSRPGKISAVGGMLIGGGAWAIFVNVLSIFVSVGLWCFWPGFYFGIVWAIFAIIRGAGLLGDRWRSVDPKVVVILQIVQAVNLDLVNVAMGIIGLVFLNERK